MGREAHKFTNPCVILGFCPFTLAFYALVFSRQHNTNLRIQDSALGNHEMVLVADSLAYIATQTSRQSVQ